jgi:hypothetical protein
MACPVAVEWQGDHARPGGGEAVTVREQLAEQASRPRPVERRNYVTSLRDWRKILTLSLDREITLTARTTDPSLLRKLVTVGAVNAVEVCGIPARHLLITRIWVDAPNVGCLTATSDHIIYIELLDSPSPLRGSPEVDFNALLAALDGKAGAPDVPPDRAETWHDRKPMI